ncbi:MAG: amidohydrolase [Spirosomataceae bacterium]
MQNLTVTLIQSALYWENPTANLAMFEEKIAQLSSPTDLIILPEMFNTGFTMNTEAVGEPMNLTTTKWMKQMAAQTGAVITGSFIVKEGGLAYNRLVWMQPNGQFDYYDKRHLFRMAGEHHHFAAGTRRLIQTLKGWQICPLICYDLRFPVWSRNVNRQYDLLLYVANWPEARSQAWKALLQARAIENLSYVIGVNRVGQDGKGLPYSGDSVIHNFVGDRLFECQHDEVIHTQTLDYEAMRAFRERFPAHLDADTFTLEN